MSVGLVLGSLLVGAFATSYAEYKFSYNLYDYVVEGAKKLLGVASKAEAVVASGVKAVEKKL